MQYHLHSWLLQYFFPVQRVNLFRPVLKALVLGMKGPLVDGEIARTKEYAKELAAKLK
jgi:hypothetical protein